jgi:hypothetical protein
MTKSQLIKTLEQIQTLQQSQMNFLNQVLSTLKNMPEKKEQAKVEKPKSESKKEEKHNGGKPRDERPATEAQLALLKRMVKREVVETRDGRVDFSFLPEENLEKVARILSNAENLSCRGASRAINITRLIAETHTLLNHPLLPGTVQAQVEELLKAAKKNKNPSALGEAVRTMRKAIDESSVEEELGEDPFATDDFAA